MLCKRHMRDLITALGDRHDSVRPLQEILQGKVVRSTSEELQVRVNVLMFLVRL